MQSSLRSGSVRRWDAVHSPGKHNGTAKPRSFLDNESYLRS
jgi:hypothetical protein